MTRSMAGWSQLRRNERVSGRDAWHGFCSDRSHCRQTPRWTILGETLAYLCPKQVRRWGKLTAGLGCRRWPELATAMSARAKRLEWRNPSPDDTGERMQSQARDAARNIEKKDPYSLNQDETLDPLPDSSWMTQNLSQVSAEKQIGAHSRASSRHARSRCTAFRGRAMARPIKDGCSRTQQRIASGAAAGARPLSDAQGIKINRSDLSFASLQDPACDSDETTGRKPGAGRSVGKAP